VVEFIVNIELATSVNVPPFWIVTLPVFHTLNFSVTVPALEVKKLKVWFPEFSTDIAVFADETTPLVCVENVIWDYAPDF